MKTPAQKAARARWKRTTRGRILTKLSKARWSKSPRGRVLMRAAMARWRAKRRAQKDSERNLVQIEVGSIP
jgi:hypothetical protein